jgi:hypothetical protein
MDWRPDPQILEKTATREPSKPLPGATDKTIKTGFDGFDGSQLAVFSQIEATPDAAPSDQELVAATAILNRAGVRIMRLEGGEAIGVWSDLDLPAIRAALRILGMGELPVRYLDGPAVPLKYKLRRIAGEPVPEYVRLEMERSSEPWKVREQMLGLAWRFVPWPAVPEPAYSIDPATGVRPINEWGGACGGGFVSAARFGPGDLVIPRTRRKTTRKPPTPRKRRGEVDFQERNETK